METVSINELVEAGVHFGCRVSRWNPKMAPYIYGRRNLIHIIDLKQTLRGIIRARNVLYHLAAEGSSVLWVGTKRQVKGVIAETGERTGMPIVTERWIGGTLTNFSVIRGRLRRLEELERMEEDGSIHNYSKKMIASLRREKRKIDRNLGGIREMSAIPGAMVVVDPAREYNAVREARKLGLVVIGLLDTDCDPSQVDIVIPGNDDALKSVRLLVEQLAVSVEEGAANHRENMATMGVARKSGDERSPADGPRPTREIRPIPPLVKEGESAEGGGESSAAQPGESSAAQGEAPAPASSESSAEAPAETPSETPSETPKPEQTEAERKEAAAGVAADKSSSSSDESKD